MTNDELSELELLVAKGRWEATQQLFVRMNLRQHGRSSAAVDELALAIFAQDADRTRTAIDKLRIA